MASEQRGDGDIEQSTDGTERCSECGSRAVFLTYESREDGRCAHCRLGIPWVNSSVDTDTDRSGGSDDE
ncbi:small CPxCG-related zinc finger protein [Natronomonas pharaonis DSM 2160]|uniref:Small CPxCG-related zinc finger protein n=1 Tax=Natronomonas pharaonis (strain ATCC 35678 / DSM 2160 / CIP 103997 / JCM 8858 / NBRC 14720 / NCIMB 2260 / Gabara) TaxID=348780 RepID=A0A1U7EZQ6_NATPD|nr:small CPxCG-related zinc finger protein [Natronomonas pharaonis DSM 2160]